MTVRARIYLRISDNRRGDRLGVERQEPPCRELCARKGWEVVEPPYMDDDTSAYSGQRRKAFESMIADTVADAAAGDEVAIVAWAADRLTRRPVENEGLIDLADRHHVQLATVTGNHDLASPSGRLHFRMLGSIARYESEHRAARLRLWHDQRAEEGLFHGGRPPFGYRLEEGKGLVIDREQADAIQDAVKRIREDPDGISRGSLAAICRDWAKEDVMRSTSGRRIGVTQLGKLLRSPHLAGVRIHRGERRKATWEPILTEDEQRAVISILEGRSPKRQRRPTRTRLGGLLVCGEPGENTVAGVEGICGARMRGAPLTGRTGPKPGYRCQAIEGGCGRLHRLAGPIDEYVSEAVIVALTNGAEFATMFAEQRQAATDERLGALLGRVREEEERLNELVDLLADGMLNKEQFARAKARVNRRLEAARWDLARTSGLRALRDVPSGEEALRAAWEDWDDERRRAVIGAVVERVIVVPVGRGRRADPARHVQIIWKFS
jgi:site-specific DNA recombinase